MKLSKGGDVVRAVDIAARLGFARASVSVAMKKLREAQLIAVDTDGAITLTKGGNALAQRVLERHNFLCDWLISLGVPSDIAARDACQLEHILSDESFGAIKDSMKKLVRTCIQ